MLSLHSHDRAKKKSSLKSMMSSRSGSSGGGGGAICGVLLDSVIHAGHIAAIHADRTDCGQCREDKALNDPQKKEKGLNIYIFASEIWIH